MGLQGSGKHPTYSRHGGMLEECSRINNDVFVRKSLSLREELRAVGRNQWESMGMVGLETAKGNMKYINIPKRCLPVSPPFPTVRAPIYKCYYIYIYSTPSISSTCLRLDRLDGNEWGVGSISKKQTYYLQCLSLCLKL